MVLLVTPCHVAPPLLPPAHCATHGGCSSSPVTQNDFPVVEPLAGGCTPRLPAFVVPPLVGPVDVGPVEPVVPVVPVVPVEPVVPVLVGPMPLDVPPGVVAPGTVVPGAALPVWPDGNAPLNWPPSGPLPDAVPCDGATMTSTVWAA